jgi:hypothetical protein
MNKFERTTLPSNAIAVTPSDSLNIIGESVVLFVGTGGTVKVTTSGGQDVVLSNVQDGTTIPLMILKVWATGTTATNIVAFY